jgi:ADP-heptose:LPS heptosyltransferase
MSEYISIEEEPIYYKKRYYKGCLEKNKKANIQVLRYGGIGDIQFIIPAIREIKKRYPEVKIRMAVMEKDREMISNCDFIDSFCQTHFPTIKDLAWADFVLDFFDTVEGIGEDEAKLRNPIDISAEIVGLKLSDYKGFWKTTPEEKKWAESVFAGRKGLKIAMPLSASSPHRAWTMQDELITKLVEWNKDITVVIFGEGQGHAEAVYNRIKRLNLPNVIDMIGKTTTRQYVNLALECDLIFTNDSGIVNIGAIFDKKILAIYSTVPKETRTSHFPTVEGLQVKSSCSPCYYLHHECKQKDKCLNTITVNEVYLKITEMVGR